MPNIETLLRKTGVTPRELFATGVLPHRSLGAVYRLIQRGKIPATKVGNKLVIPTSFVRRVIEPSGGA